MLCRPVFHEWRSEAIKHSALIPWFIHYLVKYSIFSPFIALWLITWVPCHSLMTMKTRQRYTAEWNFCSQSGWGKLRCGGNKQKKKKKSTSMLRDFYLHRLNFQLHISYTYNNEVWIFSLHVSYTYNNKVWIFSLHVSCTYNKKVWIFSLNISCTYSNNVLVLYMTVQLLKKVFYKFMHLCII